MSIVRPGFSVIVNTVDRAGPLYTLLRALEQQSYSNFEVVVVVGPTRDNTLKMLDQYAGRIRVLRCPVANLGTSRNIGLCAAQGEIVAFIDDDAVPSHHWLEQLSRLFTEPRLAATGGIVYLINPQEPRIQYRIGIFSSLAEQVDVRSSYLECLVPPGEGNQWVCRMMGTNMAFRRKDLLQIGGFDEFYEWVYDETDVAMRIANAGGIIYPIGEAAVYHIPASSRNRQMFTYNMKWWLQTRASVYSAIKNGRLAGDSNRAVLWRCLHLVHGHWLMSNELLRAGKISYRYAWRMRLGELSSGIIGAVHGLLSARKLIQDQTAHTTGTAAKPDAPILPFQNESSALQPAVDPMSSHQPSITLTEPPLRVCLLSRPFPPLEHGGVGRQTQMLAKGLFECGHTVHVITRGDTDRASFRDGAYVHELQTRLEHYDQYKMLPGMYYLLNHSQAIYGKVKQLILNDGIQIVDSSNWQFEGLVTCVSGAIPVVVRLVTAMRQIAPMHEDHSEDMRLQGEMERVLAERAAHLLPNTRATLETLSKVYGVHPREDQYSIAPYGIEPVPDEETRPFDLTRARGDLKVLFMGRLEKRKGILDLFEAIPLVLQRVPNVRFVIAGGDNSHNDGFRRRTGMDYRTYFARRYPAQTSSVEFIGEVEGDSPQHKGLYQSCDLFVAPSLYESFGLIYPEAMNYAKPVIGCRAGGIPEVVEHGATGLLTDPEAPKELAQAMITLLKSPQKLRDMGLAGRQRLLEKFTYIQMARNFASIYRKVIDSANRIDHQ